MIIQGRQQRSVTRTQSGATNAQQSVALSRGAWTRSQVVSRTLDFPSRVVGDQTLTDYTTLISLDPSSGVASASLALTAPTQIPPDPINGQASATLGLTAPTQIPLATSGLGSTTLGLTAPAQIPLAATLGVASATLGLKAPTQISLNPVNGVASVSLTLTAKALISLSSSGVASVTLNLTTPSAAVIVLDPVNGVASTTLGLTVPTRISLAPVFGVANATLALVYIAPDFRVLIVLNPMLFPPGTTVNSYRYEDVEPWAHGRRVPPASYIVDTAVVAADRSVTIKGFPGLNVLWATVFPKPPVWQEPIPEQQYVAFNI